MQARNERDYEGGGAHDENQMGAELIDRGLSPRRGHGNWPGFHDNKTQHGFQLLMWHGDLRATFVRHCIHVRIESRIGYLVPGFSTAAVGGFTGAAGRAGFIQQSWTLLLKAATAF